MTTTTRTTKSKIIHLVWDEHEIIKAQARYLLEEGEAANENEAFEMACGDNDHVCFEYEDFLEDFSAILKRLSPKGCFHIEGQNMGWRHLSGELDLDAQDAQSFIARSFPHTNQWRLEGEYDPSLKCLTYLLYHHDAPGGEKYEVTPMG